MSEPHFLDAVIQRLAALPGVTVKASDVSYFYPGNELAEMLALRHERISTDVQALSVQIAEWGRLAAIARRGWQEADRAYRIWRDRLVIQASTPQDNVPSWKKPTEKAIEAMYRTHKDYSAMQAAIEHAEEECSACMATLDGLRAKRDMLRTFVMRAVEDSSPRLAV